MSPNKIGASVMGDFNLAWAGHSISLAALAGSIVGWFPHVAGLVALIWYGLQIYESATIQAFFHTRRLRRIAKLKKEMARLEAQEKTAEHRKQTKEGNE